MSNGRYHRREFGSRAAGVNSNGFNRSRFPHQNFNYQRGLPHRMAAPQKWTEWTWQPNIHFHQRQRYRGTNLQYRANVRNRASIDHRIVRHPGPDRPAFPPFSTEFARHPVPRESLPVENEEEDEHQVPLPGSEEERQKKILEAADKLKQKLSSLAEEEELTRFPEEDWSGESSKTPKEDETGNRSIPELRHEPPELDLTFSDLRDIGRVNSNNSSNNRSNMDVYIVQQGSTGKSTNVITIKDKKDKSERTHDASDEVHELLELTCETENFKDNIGKKAYSHLSEAVLAVDSSESAISKKSFIDLSGEQSSAMNFIETSGNERIQKSNENTNRNIADISANVQYICHTEIQLNTDTYNSQPLMVKTRSHDSRHRFKQNRKRGFSHDTQKFNQLPALMHVPPPSYSHNASASSHNLQQKAPVPFSTTFEPRSNIGSEKHTSQGNVQATPPPLVPAPRSQNVPVSEQVPGYNPKTVMINKREGTFQSSSFMDHQFLSHELNYSPLNQMENSPVASFNTSPNYMQLPPVNVLPYPPFSPTGHINFPPVLLPPQVPLVLSNVTDPPPLTPEIPIEDVNNQTSMADNFNYQNIHDGLRAGMKFAREILGMTDESNSEKSSISPEVPSSISATPKRNKKTDKKDDGHVVNSSHFKNDGASKKDHEGTLLKDHRPKALNFNSPSCKLQKTEERLKTPVNFPEIHQDASLNKQRIYPKENYSRKSTDLSNEKSNVSPIRRSDKRDPESQRVSSTEDNQRSKKESVKDKVPPSESSWKAKVINRFLKMSKNDICNMVNNASLRKFDLVMKHLVKERKPSLFLEMRSAEDEKMKEYNQEEFINQLNAMLDSGDIVCVKDLPTEFIHHLSEVLQLDSLRFEVESSQNEVSDVQALPENLMTTEMESTSLNEVDIERGKPRVLLDQLDDAPSEVTEEAKKIPSISTSDSGEKSNETRISLPLTTQPVTKTSKYNSPPRINNPKADIFTADITQARKQIDANSDRSRVRKCSSEDRNLLRREKYEARNRKVREDVDSYLNLIKEEREARYKSKYSAASSSIRNTESISSESVKDKGKRYYSSESPLRSSSASPVIRRHRTAIRLIESDESSSSSSSMSSSNTSSSKTSSSSSSVSSTNSSSRSSSSTSCRSTEETVSPSVTKLLKVIKKNEKIAKNKSINEKIRDEVAAEIEEQRKQKSRQKARKREKRRRYKERQNLKKKKGMTNYYDSAESDKKSKELQLLDESKREQKKESKHEDKTNSFKNSNVVHISSKSQIEKQQIPKEARETSKLERHQSAETKTQLKPLPKVIEVDHSELAQKSGQTAKDSKTDSNNGKLKSISTNEDKKVAKSREQVMTSPPVSSERVSPTTATSSCSTENKSYKKIDINAYKERKRLKDQAHLKENPKNSKNQDITRALPASKLNVTSETRKPEIDKVQSTDHSLIGDKNIEVSKKTDLREEQKPVVRKDKETSVSQESNSGHKNVSSSKDLDSTAKNKSKLSCEVETKKSPEQNKSKPAVQSKSKKSISLVDCPMVLQIQSEDLRELTLKKNIKHKKISKLDEIKSVKKDKETSESKQEISKEQSAVNSPNPVLKIEDKTVREEIHTVIKQNQESVDDNEKSTNSNNTIEKSILPNQQVEEQKERSIDSRDEDSNKNVENKVPSKELHLRINVDIEKSGPSINIKSLTNNSVLTTESKVTDDAKQNVSPVSLLSTDFNIHDKITKSNLSSLDSPDSPCKGFPAADNDANKADKTDLIRNEGSPSGDPIIQQDVINVSDRNTGISEIKQDATEKCSGENQRAGVVSEKGNEPYNGSLNSIVQTVDKESIVVKLDNSNCEGGNTTDFLMGRSSDTVISEGITSMSSTNNNPVFDKDNANKDAFAEKSLNEETTIKDLRQNSNEPVTEVQPDIQMKTATVPIINSTTKVNNQLILSTFHDTGVSNDSVKKDEVTSQSQQTKSKSHKIRHKSKMKHKKEKLKIPKEIIKETIKSDLVNVVEHPSMQDGIMARMVEIDVEIHKLMTEKMTLYRMLKDMASNNNDPKESTEMQQEQESDLPRPVTPAQLMSLVSQEKIKTNETPVESSSVIETSINEDESNKLEPEDEKGVTSALISDNGEKPSSKKKKKHKAHKVIPSASPKSVLAVTEPTGVNEVGATDALTDDSKELVENSSQVSSSETNPQVVIDKISTETDNEDPVSDDKPEVVGDIQPLIKETVEEKLIGNYPIKDNKERSANLKDTDTSCSVIRAPIYSDDSTPDSSPPRADGTKEQKRPNVGLTLLEETYKKEIAMARRKSTARSRRKDSRHKLPKIALTVAEEDLPLSMLYTKKRKNQKKEGMKQKLPDPAVHEMDDDVSKNIDEVINAVAENRVEMLHLESTERIMPSISERNVDTEETGEKQTIRNDEDSHDKLSKKIPSSTAHELLSSKHVRFNVKGNRSPEASDIEPVGSNDPAESTESRYTKTDDKNIQRTASKTVEVGEDNRKPGGSINDIERVRKYSTKLNDDQNTIVISDDERDSKRKSNDSVILQSDYKNRDDHFISLRDHKESHKVKEIVEGLCEENSDHNYMSASSVTESIQTSKNVEEFCKKSNKRKRENIKDTARRRSKYESPVKKRAKSETSANTEPDEQYKCFSPQDVPPSLAPYEENRIQKKGQHSFETDPFFFDGEYTKAMRKQKLDTMNTMKQKLIRNCEMMNCVVKVVDCKRTTSNLNINPSVPQSYGISKVNTQPQCHPTQMDSLISPQKVSPQSQVLKTIKRLDDRETNFAKVKRSKSVKMDLNDGEGTARRYTEVMPILTKQEVKKKKSSDVLLVDEKTIAKSQQPIEDPPPTLTVIDTKDDKLARTQYTVHSGPILDIKVYGDSFLAASEDGNIYRYNQSFNGILNIYKGHTAAVTCLHMFNASSTDSSKEWIFSGSLDGTLRCYNLMTGVQARDTACVGSPIQCMDEAWGIIFVGTKSGHVSRYHIKSGTIKEDSIQFSDKSVLALKATNEGPRRVLIVASRSQPITIRDAQNGLFLRAICGERSYTVYSLMRDNNVIYCGTSSTSIPVFDFTNGQQMKQYDAGVGIVCMRLYKSLLFAGCYDGNIYVFDTKEHRLICSIPGPGNMLLSMDVTDNKIIAGSKDKRLQSWQMPEQVLSCM